MTDMLLGAILAVLILIWLQGNRVGEEVGRRINRAIYNRRTRKL